jgi:hypothetical protein
MAQGPAWSRPAACVGSSARGSHGTWRSGVGSPRRGIATYRTHQMRVSRSCAGPVEPVSIWVSNGREEGGGAARGTGALQPSPPVIAPPRPSHLRPVGLRIVICRNRCDGASRAKAMRQRGQRGRGRRTPGGGGGGPHAVPSALSGGSPSQAGLAPTRVPCP